jgi:hypothetical protein
MLVEGKERFDWKRVLLVAILGFAAIAYRAAGVVVIPAVGLYALLHIRLHGWERGWRLLMPVALWLAVLVGASVLLHRNASSALTGTFVLAKLVRHALHYKYALFGSLTYPFPWDGANDAFHAVGLAIAVIGVVVWLRKREARYSMLAMYTFGTAAMLALVWAMADRYIWPLFPVLAYCFLLGIRALTRLVRRASTLEWRTRVAAAVLMLVTLSATAVAAAKPRPVGFMDRPDVRDIFARVSRLGREENARVLFVNPRVLAWQTGVPSMGLFDATDSQTMAELERKEITHVIVGDVGLARHNSRLLREFLANHPAAFQAVYQNAGFTLYRFRAR